MPFKFENYDRIELAACGTAFIKDVVQAVPQLGYNTPAWTEFVLDWFAATTSHRVNARGVSSVTDPEWRRHPYWPVKRQTHGEMGFDLDHSELDADTDYRNLAAWHQTLQHSCRTWLVLESEFGVRRSEASTSVEIFVDALKLARASAAAKVMIFSSCRPDHRDRVYADLTNLRSKSGDSAPWLCIDLPWEEDSPGVYRPDFRVLPPSP